MSDSFEVIGKGSGEMLRINDDVVVPLSKVLKVAAGKKVADEGFPVSPEAARAALAWLLR